MVIDDRTDDGRAIGVVLAVVQATGQRLVGIDMPDRILYLTPTGAIRLAEQILEMARKEQS